MGGEADRTTSETSEPRAAAPDVEALRATCREARQVLDHQIAYLNDVDDKAMRTVRIAVLVLTAFASVARLSGAADLTNMAAVSGLFTAVGTSALVASILGGLVAYSVSEPEFGVSPRYLREVEAGGFSEEEWLTTVLAGYGEWMSRNDAVNRRDALYLWWTQALLGVGVSLVALGLGLSLWFPN